jgi:heme exporter protein D
VYWSSVTDFLAMGGHAGFIWPAFGLGIVILGGLALLSHRALGEAERDVAEARKEAGRDP